MNEYLLEGFYNELEKTAGIGKIISTVARKFIPKSKAVIGRYKGKTGPSMVRPSAYVKKIGPVRGAISAQTRPSTYVKKLTPKTRTALAKPIGGKNAERIKTATGFAKKHQTPLALGGGLVAGSMLRGNNQPAYPTYYQ